jgi:hypothetical protein
MTGIALALGRYSRKDCDVSGCHFSVVGYHYRAHMRDRGFARDREDQEAQKAVR